jgi:hypothetical protein
MINKILRSIVTIYEHDADEAITNRKVSSHLMVFQDLTINTPSKLIAEDVMFIVVNMPKLDSKKDPSESLQLFMKDMKRKKNLYLVTIVTNTRMSNSLLVFMKKDNVDVTVIEQSGKKLNITPVW